MEDKIRVLMVDDEEQFRATTKKILDRRGFETILAGSGEEAIEKIEENPNVVILDIKMPGMDGLEALAEIKKLSPDLPVIMLTGHGSEPSAREALSQDAFDYLAKPCDIDVLASKIVDAYQQVKREGPPLERTVQEVMIPIEDYTTLKAEATIKEAVASLKESFSSKAATGRLMETGHRSLLVIDDQGRIQGIMAIIDLLQAVLPAYLSAPNPTTADSMQYSTM
ncbi:MAG: response regulator, partial [Deltaproteobacteria bacterium]|nr:response regulator [Deltaproteobacteria bacterium]